ncbi:MAG: type II secretion system F family protein [Anaerolineae bacterium]|nr:type II secretion system F family protein [Anaerolineae bacterium]
MDTILLYVAGALFLGAIVYAVITIVRGGRDDVSERLDRYADAQAIVEERRKTESDRKSLLGDRLDEALEKRGFANNIRTQLSGANLKMTAGEFLAATVICIILFAVIGFLFRGIIVALVAGVIGFFVPRWYVSISKSRRLNTFDSQLADTINLMVNSIRAGYSVLQAMEAVAREMPAPISEEFQRVVKEVQLGLSVEQAMMNMVRRIPSEDLDLMITAINVQREVGGNLAEVLDAINFTIRERVRIKGEVRALTAQGRYSGYLISFMPVALTFFIYLINPSFIMQLVEDPCGWIMIAVAVGGIFAGFMVIRKIVDIDV